MLGCVKISRITLLYKLKQNGTGRNKCKSVYGREVIQLTKKKKKYQDLASLTSNSSANLIILSPNIMSRPAI